MPKLGDRRELTNAHGTYLAEWIAWTDPRTLERRQGWAEVDDEEHNWLRESPRWCSAIGFYLDGAGTYGFEDVLWRLERAGFAPEELINQRDENPYFWPLIEAAVRGEFHDDYASELGASGGGWPDPPRSFTI